MVKFLLQRPIAVIMTFVALVIVGCITYFALPVSLLPAIDIPRIIVRVESNNSSSREIESTVTAPLRRQLQQVGGLDDIRSISYDGHADITLTFDYGVDTDLAFIEVNEKIDAAMSYLPRSLDRPRAVKASATDIPVVYLQLTLRDGTDSEARFIEMVEIADNVVRRSIEQMQEIAMVDVTGIPSRYIRIVPDLTKTHSAGITADEIETTVNANNYSPGAMTVRDGYYEYHINVANQLRTVDDVKNICLNHNGRLFRLGDIADIELAAGDDHGISTYNGKRAVTLAIIKHDSENIDRMRSALDATIGWLSAQYPDIDITVSRNQTELLDFTISNLLQNLVLGLIFVFLITALFMHDLRTPVVIGVSIVVALFLTMLLFYLFGVSLNIISLSGLILAVGMMIDNSVIVTENITQWRQHGHSVTEACDRGTTEMITPMLSSTLTTIAVFLPLIFLSGIAGAIFADQAFSISAGLIASYITGIALLPVLYSLTQGRRGNKTTTGGNYRYDRAMNHIYDRVIDSVFSHKRLWIAILILLLPLCWLLFRTLHVEKMPQITHHETLADIKWNESLTSAESRDRIDKITAIAGNDADETSAYIGPQDYLLDDGNRLQQSEAQLYVKCSDSATLDSTTTKIRDHISSHYPLATVSFMPPENVFEKIFTSSDPMVEARLSPKSGTAKSDPTDYMAMRHLIDTQTGDSSTGMPVIPRLSVTVDDERLALYRVGYDEVTGRLRDAFKNRQITTLRSFNQYTPISFGAKDKSLEQVLSQTLATTTPDAEGKQSLIPLSSLVSLGETSGFAHIVSGKSGEYLPVAFADPADPARLIDKVTETVRADNGWDIELSGQYFANNRMMNELTWVLIISLILMYFIMCAQFESFVQPLVVLIEIPVDTAFALLTLWIFGYTLNLMSAIGIIVSCGIVVNDSILKLDAINQLRRTGMPLIEAIHTAGRRRLRPILMTSLTTILAMLPILFTSDMGSELQQPLAVAMIGAMVAGTLVSIFLIPLVYYLIYRNAKV